MVYLRITWTGTRLLASVLTRNLRMLSAIKINSFIHLMSMAHITGWGLKRYLWPLLPETIISELLVTISAWCTWVLMQPRPTSKSSLISGPDKHPHSWRFRECFFFFFNFHLVFYSYLNTLREEIFAKEIFVEFNFTDFGPYPWNLILKLTLVSKEGSRELISQLCHAKQNKSKSR